MEKVYPTIEQFINAIILNDEVATTATEDDDTTNVIMSPVDVLTSPYVMVILSIALAILYIPIVGASKNFMMKHLPSYEWWPRAIEPTKRMMYNFGYPNQVTSQFPDGVTEPMARHFFAYITTICFNHFVETVPMLPVIIYGWDSVTMKYQCMFVMSTIIEVAYTLYDSMYLTIGAFCYNNNEKMKQLGKVIPIDFWIVLVVLHHTLAMTFILPMNYKYIHLVVYQQMACALLLAGGICYLAGNYKFTLDIKHSKFDFYQYKLIVILQLITILYTRVYLWFPSMYKTIQVFRENNDTFFICHGCVLGIMFSIFNVVLVVDGTKATMKWLPRKFVVPSATKDDKDKTLQNTYEIDEQGWETSPDSGAIPVAEMVQTVREVRRRSVAMKRDMSRRSMLLKQQISSRFFVNNDVNGSGGGGASRHLGRGAKSVSALKTKGM